MTRTKLFYEEISSFRENLRNIEKEYTKGLSNIEKYKGSAAYTEELRKLESKRTEAVKQAQEKTSKILFSLLSEMREAATSRPMIAPTQDVINLLQTLKMRSKISSDELQQAARTVGDCPIALSVLDELAQDQGHMGLHFGKESTDSVLRHIETLTRNVKKIAKMESVDRRREAVEASRPDSQNYNPAALELVFVDRDFNSEEDALAWLGGVVDFDSFSKAVN